MIFTHAIKMASFDHERPRANQSRHFRVVECAAEIPFEDFVLARPDVTEVLTSTRVLQHPFVEVGLANGQAVISYQRRNSHRGFSAIAESVKCDAIAIHIGLRLQPVHDLLMLRHDDGE